MTLATAPGLTQSKRRRYTPPKVKAKPRRVDFFGNGTDFMAVMLFNIGMESEAIANLTGLTKGQVEYRLRCAELELRQKAQQQKRQFISARRMYRKGISPVSKMIVSQITGRNSRVKSFVADVLDKRGLYAPKSKGVLKDE